jgi:hypothetical protein
MSWKCSCGTVMSSLQVLRCRTCGKDKSQGESLIKMRGDWMCTNCQKNNFARRIKCFSCGGSKVTYTFSLYIVHFVELEPFNLTYFT